MNVIVTKVITKALFHMAHIIKGLPEDVSPLEMIWPENKRGDLPQGTVSIEYNMRQFAPDDLEQYNAMMLRAEMGKPRLEYWNQHILPDGFFVVEYKQTRELVAANFASHHPTIRHPFAGNLGWLAVDPAHRGKGLGRAVSAAVTSRLIEGGYQRIYLETHDHRLPAIATYLKMGWVPFLYDPDMHERWSAICDALNWPFAPEHWGGFDYIT